MFGRSYINSLWLSLSTPAYYLTLIREKIWVTLLFLGISCIWIGWLQALHFNLYLLPAIKTDTLKTIENLERSYPADLDLSWNGLKLESSAPDKVIIPFPDLTSIETNGLPSTATIILNQELSPTEFEASPRSTLSVVTPTTVYVSTQRAWNAFPLTDLPGFNRPFTINQSNISHYTSGWKKLADQVFGLSWLSYLILPGSIFISSLWTSLINAALVYFILRVGNMRFRYSTLFKFSVHVVVACLILVQLQRWLYTEVSWPLFEIGYWLCMGAIIWYVRNQVSQQRFKTTQT